MAYPKYHKNMTEFGLDHDLGYFWEWVGLVLLDFCWFISCLLAPLSNGKSQTGFTCQLLPMAETVIKSKKLLCDLLKCSA